MRESSDMSSVTTITAPSLHEVDKAFALLTRGGDHVWLSGQTAHDESGQLVGEGDVAAQARYIFQKIERLLAEHAGVGMSSIVRLTTYFVMPLSAPLKSQYWDVRREFFGSNPPASTGVQVAGLVTPETLIEIDAVAYAPVQQQPSSRG